MNVHFSIPALIVAGAAVILAICGVLLFPGVMSDRGAFDVFVGIIGVIFLIISVLAFGFALTWQIMLWAHLAGLYSTEKKGKEHAERQD